MGNSNIILNLTEFATNDKSISGNYGVVFKKLSFSIIKDSITTLFAPHGSGKSTLLKTIIAQKDDNIKFFGNKMFYIHRHSIALEGLCVEDNIKLYVPNASIDTIRNCLKIVGLEGYEKHIPVEKSKGFIFRIALAIGLLLKADLFLLDDVFNDMKYNTKIDIFNLLFDLKNNQNLTFFIASSNLLDSLILSDKLIFAKGSPFEILFEENIELNIDNFELKLKSESFLQLKDALIKRLYEHNIRDFIL